MNRWESMQELFERMTGSEPRERERLLRTDGQADQELHGQIKALMRAHEQPAERLDTSASQVLLEMSEEAAPGELCGSSFGPYRIEEHLSSGGTAHVYRATRIDAGTERRVAFKVLRPGLERELFEPHFQRERETLAALEHEHIVAFLDSGSLPDGSPYLVMEYVQGTGLREWGRGVSQRQRIELFLKVLGALQYAHQQLVVHRDLKPANVLVTAQGVPKLLDFGVSTRLTDGTHAPNERHPMTRIYASPEQRRGASLTTASDLYSAGLLLNELLTGHPSSLEHEEASIPRQLPKGDLGLIVKRALEADPADRYRSADHFADDLSRTLAHELPTGIETSTGHRAFLFLRRHRLALLLACAVLFAAIAGWVASDLARRDAVREASVGWGAHGQARGTLDVQEEWILEVAANDPLLAGKAIADMEVALARVLTRSLGQTCESEVLLRLLLARLYLQSGGEELAREHTRRLIESIHGLRGIGPQDRERVLELKQLLLGPELESNT